MGMEADIGPGLPEPAGNDHTTMGDFVDNKHRNSDIENDKEIKDDIKIRLYYELTNCLKASKQEFSTHLLSKGFISSFQRRTGRGRNMRMDDVSRPGYCPPLHSGGEIGGNWNHVKDR
jgi:hypothetical protein